MLRCIGKCHNKVKWELNHWAVSNKQFCNRDDQPWVYKAAHPIIFIVCSTSPETNIYCMDLYHLLLVETLPHPLSPLNIPQCPSVCKPTPSSAPLSAYKLHFPPFSGINRRSVTALPSPTTDGARPILLSSILFSSLSSIFIARDQSLTRADLQFHHPHTVRQLQLPLIWCLTSNLPLNLPLNLYLNKLLNPTALWKWKWRCLHAVSQLLSLTVTVCTWRGLTWTVRCCSNVTRKITELKNYASVTVQPL